MSRSARLIFVFAIVLATLVITGCFVPVGGPGSTLQISVGETGYEYDATLGFGPVDIAAGPLTVTATVTNIAEAEVTVTELVTTGVFAIEASAPPFTVAPGQSEEVSLSFDPVEVGAAVGTLEISIEGLALPFVLNLTGTGTEVAAADSLKVVIGTTDYVSGSSYDFGFRDPGAEAVGVPISLVNLLAEEVTVTAVSAGADGITLVLPAVPFVIAAESSTAGVLAFDPAGTVVAAVQFDVTVAGVTGVFTFNAGGEGNYAPVANAVTHVSGAGTAAVNGTYYRTEEIEDGCPVYRLTGTDYRIYRANPEVSAWAIDNDFEFYPAHYENWTGTSTAPNGVTGEDWWVGGNGDADPPSTVGEIKSSLGGVDELQPGDVISPNYLYSDAEGNTEGATLFQWYLSDSPSGTYLLLDGETDSSHTVTGVPFDAYFKVLVTPVATDGIMIGEPIWFGPSPVVYNPFLP